MDQLEAGHGERFSSAFLAVGLRFCEVKVWRGEEKRL